LTVAVVGGGEVASERVSVLSPFDGVAAPTPHVIVTGFGVAVAAGAGDPLPLNAPTIAASPVPPPTAAMTRAVPADAALIP